MKSTDPGSMVDNELTVIDDIDRRQIQTVELRIVRPQVGHGHSIDIPDAHARAATPSADAGRRSRSRCHGTTRPPARAAYPESQASPSPHQPATDLGKKTISSCPRDISDEAKAPGGMKEKPLVASLAALVHGDQ